MENSVGMLSVMEIARFIFGKQKKKALTVQMERQLL